MKICKRIVPFCKQHEDVIYLTLSIALLAVALLFAVDMFKDGNPPSGKRVSIIIICIGLIVHCGIAIYRIIKKQK